MQIDNSIYIIGAGAIGKALAVFLKLAGKEVTLLRGSVEDHSVSFEKISIEVADKTLSAQIKTGTLNNYSVFNGIIVLANKSYGNAGLAHKLKKKMGNSPLVIIQNGLNIEQPFIDDAFPQIYRCVPFVSSQNLPAANTLRYRPAAVSPIGIIKGDKQVLQLIVEALENKYFEFRAAEDILPVIWTKTIINCVFNSVCPLLETDNGIFHRNKAARDIAEKLVKECLVIAEASAISISFETVMERLLLISKTSDGQLISTYQDLINNRKTEIVSLNFAVVKAAGQLNKAQFVSSTGLLGDLIQLRSALHMKS